MTREEALNILARLSGGATRPNWDDIRDAAKVCFELISRPSLPEGLDEAAEEYQERVKAHFLRTLEHPSAKDAFKAGAEFSAPRWISVEESLPPFDEEVIVLTNEMHGNTLSSACHLCFGHRPNPEGWTGRSIFTGEVHHLEPNLHDGWNIPGVRYWMPCPKIPNEEEI